MSFSRESKRESEVKVQQHSSGIADQSSKQPKENEYFALMYAKINDYKAADNIEGDRLEELKNDLNIILKRKSAEGKITYQMGYESLYDYMEYQNLYKSVPKEHTTEANFLDFPFGFINSDGMDIKILKNGSMQAEMIMIRLGIELFQAQQSKRIRYQQFLKNLLIAVVLEMPFDDKSKIIDYLTEVFLNVGKKMLLYASQEYSNLCYYWQGREGYKKGSCADEKIAESHYHDGSVISSRTVTRDIVGPTGIRIPHDTTEHSREYGENCALKYFFPFRIRYEEYMRLRGGVIMQLLSIVAYASPNLINKLLAVASLRQINHLDMGSMQSDFKSQDKHNSVDVIIEDKYVNNEKLKTAVQTGNVFMVYYLMRNKSVNPNDKAKLGDLLLQQAIISQNPLMIDCCFEHDLINFSMKNKMIQSALNFTKKHHRFAMHARILHYIDQQNLSRLDVYPKSYTRLFSAGGIAGATNILHDYSRLKKYFHFRRHHRQLARNIQADFKQDKVNENDVIQYLVSQKNNLIDGGEFNPDGSFARRINYLITNIERSNKSIDISSVSEAKHAKGRKT